VSILSLFQGQQHPVLQSEPAITVGQGLPGYTAAFEDAYQRAGGKPVLGSPGGEAAECPPGAAQAFKGASRGEPAMVCALPDSPGIAVAVPVWDAIARVGGGPARGGGLPAAGFPVPPSTSPNGQPAMIASDATEVALDGGSWGPGRLTRPGPQAGWSWEPVPRTDFNTFHSGRWTPQAPTDLQIRVIASLPWLADSPLRIGIPGRKRLITALTGSEFCAWMTKLSARRGAQLDASSWDWPSGQGTWQSDRSAHCRMTVLAPGGEPALAAEVMTQMPDGTYLANVLGIAELRINFQPWAAALARAGARGQEPSSLRITMSELASFYSVAWATAALRAPLAAVESPLALPLAGPPRVEFDFKVSPYHDSAPRTLQLGDVLDLSALGPPTSDTHRTQGGFGITAPLSLPAAQRRTLIENQIADLAQAWGFIYASPEALRNVNSDTAAPAGSSS
jgi:hypothetical protein